jgi:uncharacterized metal-binding protein
MNDADICRPTFLNDQHTMEETKQILHVTNTTAVCPIGETTGRRNIENRAIPVLSCEGACIRGEIARLAANQLAKKPGFARACHGELFSVPDSEMARWVRQAEQVLVLDGCHLKCHARIIENIAGKSRVRSFNLLARHRKYCEVFDIDDVPECERLATAKDCAAWVADQLNGKQSSGASCELSEAPGGSCSCKD